MTIAIGCDHAGVELKKEIISLLDDLHIKYSDFGTNTPESVDYPDLAHRLAEKIRKKLMRLLHPEKQKKGYLSVAQASGCLLWQTSFPVSGPRSAMSCLPQK